MYSCHAVKRREQIQKKKKKKTTIKLKIHCAFHLFLASVNERQSWMALSWFFHQTDERWIKAHSLGSAAPLQREEDLNSFGAGHDWLNRTRSQRDLTDRRREGLTVERWWKGASVQSGSISLLWGKKYIYISKDCFITTILHIFPATSSHHRGPIFGQMYFKYSNITSYIHSASVLRLRPELLPHCCPPSSATHPVIL